MAGFNHFGEIADRIKPACQWAVKQTADQIQAYAQQAAPVDTGFLRDHIYVSDWDGSDYGVMEPHTLPEVKPADDTTAIVGCAADYSMYLEFGTRFMPAQPFFYSAVELASFFFEDELAKIEAALHV
jgi:HK97 gp10 family phage protein